MSVSKSACVESVEFGYLPLENQSSSFAVRSFFGKESVTCKKKMVSNSVLVNISDVTSLETSLDHTWYVVDLLTLSLVSKSASEIHTGDLVALSTRMTKADGYRRKNDFYIDFTENGFSSKVCFKLMCSNSIIRRMVFASMMYGDRISSMYWREFDRSNVIRFIQSMGYSVKIKDGSAYVEKNPGDLLLGDKSIPFEKVVFFPVTSVLSRKTRSSFVSSTVDSGICTYNHVLTSV